MKHFFRFLKVLFLVFMVTGLTGCAKVSNPTPVENSGYPHAYPRI